MADFVTSCRRHKAWITIRKDHLDPLHRRTLC